MKRHTMMDGETARGQNSVLQEAKATVTSLDVSSYTHGLVRHPFVRLFVRSFLLPEVSLNSKKCTCAVWYSSVQSSFVTL